jgi:hypothetical protein
MAALARFDWRAYNPSDCRTQAERFSAVNFRHQLAAYLERISTSVTSPV